MRKCHCAQLLAKHMHYADTALLLLQLCYHARQIPQGCGENRLEVTGEWAWLLQAFAGQYGVRSNYAVMTHLRWVLRPGVASVSQACFELLAAKLRPLLEQEAQGGNSLTQHEVGICGSHGNSSRLHPVECYCKTNCWCI